MHGAVVVTTIAIRPAVMHAGEETEEEFLSETLADVTNNSTHSCLFLFTAAPWLGAEACG
jgi:hypothetical protein